MSIQSVSALLGLEEDSEISHAASKFLEQVKEYMLSAQNKPSLKHSQAEERALVMLYKRFFDFSLEWSTKERRNHDGDPDHTEAQRLKKRGENLVNDLQDNIINFAMCYMRLNRSIGFIQDEIGRHGKNPDKNIQWTSDTGVLLQRYRKERQDLLELNAKLKVGIPIIEEAEKHLFTMSALTRKTFGDQASETYMRAFRSALRGNDFTRAKKALKTITAIKKKFLIDKKTADSNIKDIIKAGHAYIDALEKNIKDLTTKEGKLFLRKQEIDIAMAAQDKEIQKNTQYIIKYHKPYMEYKLKSILHLKEKLLVVGSLDSLTTLFLRLLRGMSAPLPDIKTVRTYEEEVIQYIDYLLSGQFKEVDNIASWNKDAMDEFDSSMREFTS